MSAPAAELSRTWSAVRAVGRTDRDRPRFGHVETAEAHRRSESNCHAWPPAPSGTGVGLLMMYELPDRSPATSRA
ncbi:hypothetical protein [Streptomyces sp. KL116D]|uniref:hypothetical protein n=1 Tax=Streptomyces sp. KL116D TaxID=3045152 RepID=UPI003557205F